MLRLLLFTASAVAAFVTDPIKYRYIAICGVLLFVAVCYFIIVQDESALTELHDEVKSVLASMIDDLRKHTAQVSTNIERVAHGTRSTEIVKRLQNMREFISKANAFCEYLENLRSDFDGDLDSVERANEEAEQLALSAQILIRQLDQAFGNDLERHRPQADRTTMVVDYKDLLD